MRVGSVVCCGWSWSWSWRWQTILKCQVRSVQSPPVSPHCTAQLSVTSWLWRWWWWWCSSSPSPRPLSSLAWPPAPGPRPAPLTSTPSASASLTTNRRETIRQVNFTDFSVGGVWILEPCSHNSLAVRFSQKLFYQKDSSHSKIFLAEHPPYLLSLTVSLVN